MRTRSPRPLPFPRRSAEPLDVDYPGAIDSSDVDASDVVRGIFRVRERLLVAAAGPLTLLYPEWHPGKHYVRGAIDLLAGPPVGANGELVQWRRDPVNVYAFHVNAPARASSLDLSFQFRFPHSDESGTHRRHSRNAEPSSGRPCCWILARHYASRIRVVPSLRLPDGWGFAVALDGASTQGPS